jgi:cadmium resistance protein CadD (predicted permease)
MSMALYGVGYLIVLAGVLYIAHLMHIPQNWMIGIGLVLLGLGITTAVQNTRQKDPN